LIADGTKLSLAYEEYDDYRHRYDLRRLCEALEKAYREESIKNVLAILGGEVEEQEGPAGTIMFATKITGGLK